MGTEIRWGSVNEAIQTYKLGASDKDANQRYEEAVKSIKENLDLTTSEKEVTIKYFVREKDRENLLFLKGPKYPCSICRCEGYTISYCEHCLRRCLTREFDNWTSGNEIIDEAIPELTIKIPVSV